jgi:outer membrane protein TolC
VYEFGQQRSAVARAVAPAAAGILAVVLGSTTVAAQGGGAGTAPAPATIDTLLAATDTLQVKLDTTLALTEIVQRALRTSPTAAAAQANVDVARAGRRAATGEWLPTLGVLAYALHNGEPSNEAVATESSIGSVGFGVPNPGGATLPGGFTPGTGGSGSPPTTGNVINGPTTANTSNTASAATSGVAFGSAVPRYLMRSLSAQAQQEPGVTTPTTTTTTGGGGAFFNEYAQITASWDIFTWGRRLADQRYEHEQVRSALASRRGLAFQVTAQVTTTFFNLLRDEDLESVGRVQVARAANDLRAAVHRREVGTATPADVLQFEYNLALAREALISALINRRSDAYALGRLAGLDVAIEGTRTGTYDPTPLALPDTAIVSLALSQAPILLASKDSARAAAAAVASARSQYGPTLSVAGSYTWYDQPNIVLATRSGWALDVGTSYAIFNGFVRERQIEQAAAANYVAQVSQRDAVRNTRAQVQALIGAVGLSAEQLKIAEGNVTLTQEDYRVTRSRYDVGAASVLDLSVAEQNLASAEQQRVNARYNYQLARTNLETLVGHAL